ncbi:hypothetical protein AALF16_22200 [Bacillus cereus]
MADVGAFEKMEHMIHCTQTKYFWKNVFFLLDTKKLIISNS